MSDDGLFPEADAYDGDPLRPDMETPTPLSIVASLTRPEREQRVEWLIEQAHLIYDLGAGTHLGGRELVATCILFSGGNDSTTLAHLFRNRATHAIHANTTVGVEETRQYVRDTCAAWGLPLIEERGGDTFRDLVLGNVTTQAGEDVWPGGFPGPGAHGFMYQRLKERALDKARHTLGIANGRKRAAVYVAGRRRQESKKRADVPLHEYDGTVIWVSPIALWTKADMNTYRLMHDDVPVNPVAEKLHMSGECLCGAYASPGELEHLRFWYPNVANELDALGEEARAAGINPDWCVWGHGKGGQKSDVKAGRICQACDDRYQTTLDLGGVA